LLDAPAHNIGHASEGQPISYPVTVRFSPTRGEGRRTFRRPCTPDFAKQ